MLAFFGRGSGEHFFLSKKGFPGSLSASPLLRAEASPPLAVIFDQHLIVQAIRLDSRFGEAVLWEHEQCGHDLVAEESQGQSCGKAQIRGFQSCPAGHDESPVAERWHVHVIGIDVKAAVSLGPRAVSAKVLTTHQNASAA